MTDKAVSKWEGARAARYLLLEPLAEALGLSASAADLSDRPGGTGSGGGACAYLGSGAGGADLEHWTLAEAAAPGGADAVHRHGGSTEPSIVLAGMYVLSEQPASAGKNCSATKAVHHPMAVSPW